MVYLDTANLKLLKLGPHNGIIISTIAAASFGWFKVVFLDAMSLQYILTKPQKT